MELHHNGHHKTYVNGYNTAVEQLQEAQHKGDIAAQIALKPTINFTGGGHLNHTLFWENLAPKNAGGGEPPSGALGKAINDTYGSVDSLKEKMNAALAGIQGSGWAWLVKDKQTGQISVRTYAVSFVTRSPGPPVENMSKEKRRKKLTWSRTRTLSLASTSLCWVLTPGSTPTSKSPPPHLEPKRVISNTLNSLQYQNRKAEYFKAIWDVINWKAAEKRFS